MTKRKELLESAMLPRMKLEAFKNSYEQMLDNLSFVAMSVTYTETYFKVLDHRHKCSKWGKEYCSECFGGGLSNFTRDIMHEILNQKIPTIKTMRRRGV